MLKRIARLMYMNYLIAAAAVTTAGAANGIYDGSLRIHELNFLALKVERIRAPQIDQQIRAYPRSFPSIEIHGGFPCPSG